MNNHQVHEIDKAKNLSRDSIARLELDSPLIHNSMTLYRTGVLTYEEALILSVAALNKCIEVAKEQLRNHLLIEHGSHALDRILKSRIDENSRQFDFDNRITIF